MVLTEKLLTELQRRLKIGNRRGVHLNAIPANSRYKFDLNRLSKIDKNLPNNFIKALLSELPLKFRISWKDNVPDLNSLFEEDQTQLVKITKAFENLINQTEAIESEKGINTFGFGFPILARRDSADNKLTIAPILIWSLRIKRTKEFNTWEITRNEDDPIYLNEVLINHLQNDANIEIEPIPSEMLDDGLISKSELIEICKNLLKAINTKTPDDLDVTFTQKIENITSIGDKTHYEKLPLNSSNSLIDFSGLFSIFEVQKQNIINEYGNLMELEGLKIDLEDLEGHTFQPISSVETDPSQQSILHSLEATRNVLIQGPPGTGKSQTLTAILINALENNKKTIVVCEKITALEVLENALKEKGLENHFIIVRDIVKDRRAVVDSVRDRIDNSEYKKYRYKYSKETLENLIIKAKDLITNINSKHQKIDEKLLGNKIWTDIVGNLISEIKGSEEDNNLNIEKNIFQYSSQEFNSLIDLAQKGQLLYNDYKQFESSSFINPQKFVGDNPFKIEQEIDESFEKYLKSLEKIKQLESDFKNEYIKLRKKQFSVQLHNYEEIHNSISTIIEDQRENLDFLDEKKTNGIIYKTLSIFSSSKKKTIQDQGQILSLFLDLKNHLKNSKDLDFTELNGSVKSNISRLNEIKKANEFINLNFNDKVENEYQEINTLTFDAEEYKTEKLIRLQSEANQLKEIITSENWTTKNINSSNLNKLLSEVKILIDNKKEYFSNENDLFSYEFRWFQFYNNLSEPNKKLINELKNKSNWRKSFLIHYLNSMLVESANIHLPTNENEHIELDNTLKGIENEQLKFIKDFWLSKQIDATREFEQRNSNLSVGNLYLKKQGTRNKRLSLRQIVQYDADLFTTFFPIILTSPDVASNLFKGMYGYFDIVMFDEASQLRLEDNLPAILKGKQVVIAGDDHQMPPSNYFSKVFDGSVDDEDDLEEEDEIIVDKDNILLSCESLLDFASELNFHRKHLDFHYRSRHPFLIDFSNYAFYNQRLKPLPNNFEYTPIKFIQTGGTFSEHINDTEAEMVLSIIENNINRLPNGKYPTLGIATFNITQRNHIKSKILERQKFSKYEEFNAKIQELEENGMFIKNLENIQGDERDVIILSTTYGIGKDKKFTQRFGPINHSKGYKLLNVIITRAKFKIYVCSSIPEQAFMNYKEYLTVEGSNNRRAVFFAYLAYCKAISENNNDLRISVLTALSENTNNSASYNSFISGDLESPFEEEVYQSLAETLGTENLIPQLQFAGFRIDIVYDPKIIGVPKIAIECDGAKYHSSQEAYLYDRHRQKILEEHGFVFHRIWSTNWWRNTSRETTRLIDFIKNVESSYKREFVDHTNTAFAFTDDFEFIEDNNTQSTYLESEKEIEKIKSINTETIIQTKLFKDEIKLGSKIKVKYVNNGKDINVQIVETENNESSKNIQKIYFRSALAISLIGHSVGDIVKIGNLDNYVEIMEIKN
jgi:superfamily I DNA and/or RNA helicase/transcription elongation GreA/GreB family factor